MKHSISVFSSDATAVELLLFKERGRRRRTEERIPLIRNGDKWSAELDGAENGWLYQIRATGEYNPANGLFFDSAKALLDPRSKTAEWDGDNLYGAIADDSFDWENISSPGRDRNKLVIYELHVKGFTQLNKKVSKKLRGKLLGLAEDCCLEYLSELGVNAVQLMPIFLKRDEPRLIDVGLTNYWGYNPISFFAIDPRFVVSGHELSANQQFKYLVKRLHERGIEIILDVVFNHTGEGRIGDPIWSFRGFDNRAYYLGGGSPYTYADRTGCGNTVRTDHPAVTELILEALRYWRYEMRVDGFRFDLAPAVFSEGGKFSLNSPLLRGIEADDKLSSAKMIAEPWDLGSGDGYQLGSFPKPFSEWNGRYRDELRKYWRGEPGMIGALATRLSGSSDTFSSERGPTAAVNFITAHDGFTLRDLYTYEHKRNLSNLEDNRDGESHNFGWNCGEEGATESKEVLQMRRRIVRSQFASLLLSLGVPMISMGDELGRTQQGNNNAYCHDSELNWVNWKLDRDQKNLRQFVEDLIRFRAANEIFARDKFFQGSDMHGFDVRWLDENGDDLHDEQWNDGERRVLSMLLRDSDREAFILIIFNSSDQEQLVQNKFGDLELIFDTALEQPFVSAPRRRNNIVIGAKSVACYGISKE